MKAVVMVVLCLEGTKSFPASYLGGLPVALYTRQVQKSHQCLFYMRQLYASHW